MIFIQPEQTADSFSYVSVLLLKHQLVGKADKFREGTCGAFCNRQWNERSRRTREYIGEQINWGANIVGSKYIGEQTQGLNTEITATGGGAVALLEA